MKDGLSMRLSQHFTLGEGIKSQTAARRGIDNIPGPIEIDAMRAAALNILEPVRMNFSVPFSPSSWYRSPALNEAIGSKPSSQHVKGEAVDFEVPGIDNLTLARWCEGTLDFDQLILEFFSSDDPYSGWIHCSYAAGQNRRDVLTIGRNGTRKGLP